MTLKMWFLHKMCQMSQQVTSHLTVLHMISYKTGHLEILHMNSYKTGHLEILHMNSYRTGHLVVLHMISYRTGHITISHMNSYKTVCPCIVYTTNMFKWRLIGWQNKIFLQSIFFNSLECNTSHVIPVTTKCSCL